MRSLVAVLVTAAWVAPGPASAQEPVASAILYEVNEALRFVKRGARDTQRPRERRGLDTAEIAKRVARASLLGREVVPVGTHPLFKAGSFIQADAMSNVDLATGKGPITGKMKLLTDIDPTRESLDTLVVDAEAWIRGELDLTTAMQGYATLSGRWWSVWKPRADGTLQGFFLIPFQAPGDERYFYLDLGLPAAPCPKPEVVYLPDPVPVCAVELDEYALGIPLTKLVVTFLQGGS
jgi:hypothetical protein